MKAFFIRIFITVMLCSAMPACFAQHQEREVFLYNVFFGAVSSGIGAIINKPKVVNWRHAFLRGAWQGSIGGLVNYSSKKTLYLLNKNQDVFYASPALLLHAAGSSIIENAALYQPFLRNWNIDYGPVRIDWSPHRKLKVRFLPEIMYAGIRAGLYGRLNVKESLLTGIGVFETKNYTSGRGQTGYSFCRSVLITDNPFLEPNKDGVLSHELVHVFQYRDYQVLNAWLKPLEKTVRSKTINRIFSRYIYADIPYFVPFYFSQGYYPFNRYFKNFYEFEAERFSTNKLVPYRH